MVFRVDLNSMLRLVPGGTEHAALPPVESEIASR